MLMLNMPNLLGKCMYPLFETLRVENGHIYYPEWHDRRVGYSRYRLWGVAKGLDWERVTPPKEGLWRCRISYNKTDQEVSFFPYSEKIIHTLIPIEVTIAYPLKFNNRSLLNCYIKNEGFEPLFVVNGFITDTLTANIAFFIDNEWVTPSTPLLKGTTRERLLTTGLLREQMVTWQRAQQASKITLLNALRQWDETKNVNVKWQ